MASQETITPTLTNSLARRGHDPDDRESYVFIVGTDGLRDAPSGAPRRRRK